MDERTEASFVPLDDVCRRLALPPAAVRALLEAFPDIGAVEVQGETRGLSAEAFARLRAAAAGRAAGLDDAHIRQLIASAAGEVATTAAEPDASLHERLEQLAQALLRSEERRVSDHDRLMMALIRTQQEIQHLRYELAAARSRKERRKGFWARLRRR
ncbi:MAG: hypothetical protein IRZ18_02065 [Clostridia bacterium]|nr:hypothetical protein [Clostridia bacterium]